MKGMMNKWKEGWMNINMMVSKNNEWIWFKYRAERFVYITVQLFVYIKPCKHGEFNPSYT